MFKKIIKKAKAANTAISRVNLLFTSLKRIEEAIGRSQRQLEQLQQSVTQLQGQQEWLQQQALIKHINTYPADPEPTFEHVTSQLCTLGQMMHPNYRHWCSEMEQSSFLKTALPPMKQLADVHHRKVWEFCYVLQALKENNLLQPGSKGLGFAVGQEPLPALLVKYGCQVVATDLDTEEAVRKGWATGDVLQHSSKLADLNKDGICDHTTFLQSAGFRFVDMNDIPTDLTGFDFCWSACSLEHLGSIEKGIRFIKNALNCLRPGGVAVHTTEFNLSSEVATVDNQDTVIFRKQDILRLVRELEQEGHWVAPVTFNAGSLVEDNFVDIPPYYQHHFHLKLLLANYVTTSIGLIIKKRT